MLWNYWDTIQIKTVPGRKKVTQDRKSAMG
jgi:hypothetical protein